MARNGSGTYTVVNTFVAGDTITASTHNANWSDIGSEMTNSVAKDGQTTMTGPLKAASGTASAPTLTFGADTDTGIYRAGSNEIGIAVGGTQVVDITSSAANFPGVTVRQSGFDLAPVGIILPYAGGTAPSGWLLCYGQAVSRTTYTTLFTLFGTTYGSGDGSTTFNLPDLRGRVIAGIDNMGGSSAARLSTAMSSTSAGNTGGAQQVTLSTANLPAYTPSGSISISGSATVSASGFANASISLTGATPFVTGLVAQGAGNLNNISYATSESGTFTGTAQGGSSTPFNSIPPTMVLNYIIFAGA